MTVSIIIHQTVTLIWRGEGENTVARGKVKRLRMLIRQTLKSKDYNLIMPTDTNTHERKPPGGQKKLITIHMKYQEMFDN